MDLDLYLIFAAVLMPFVVISGGVAFFVRRHRKQVRALREASLSWPSTTGQVIRSSVELIGEQGTTRVARVIYRYSVGGKTYESEGVSIGREPMPAHERVAR